MGNGTLVSIIPLIEQGKTVRITPVGSSMVPFITGDRDQVELHKIDSPVRRGDIILYRRSSGKLVLHRVYRVSDAGIYLLGDGQTEVEGPIDCKQMVARCDIYYKKGICKNNNSPGIRIKYTLWRWLRPVRPILIALNNRIKRI